VKADIGRMVFEKWLLSIGAESEHRFHPTRRWRFDFAWPAIKVAVEIEGGTWAAGRHTRPAGYAGDCCKYNAAVLLGWRVLRYTTQMIANPDTRDEILQLVKEEGHEKA